MALKGIKAVFVGSFTGVVPVRVLCRFYNSSLGCWFYQCRITGKNNKFYNFGTVYNFRIGELCLKVKYSNKGNHITKIGCINPDTIEIVEV